MVRTNLDASAIKPLLQKAVAQVDPSQALTTVDSMEMLVMDSLAPRRLIVCLLAAFGGLALLLAVVGVYGLMSFVTAQRTNEIGVRMALGAQRRDVLRLILGDTLALMSIGLVMGAIASVVASALLRSAFADFGGGITKSLGVAALAMLTVGGLAGLIPAIRAASIEPVDALRTE